MATMRAGFSFGGMTLDDTAGHGATTAVGFPAPILRFLTPSDIRIPNRRMAHEPKEGIIWGANIRFFFFLDLGHGFPPVLRCFAFVSAGLVSAPGLGLYVWPMVSAVEAHGLFPKRHQ